MWLKKHLRCCFIFFICSINLAVFANNNPSDTLVHPAAITLNITTVNSTCQKENGKIIIQASGGVLPYAYSITIAGILYPGQNAIIAGLPAGTFLIKVTDALNTIATQNVTVANTYSLPATTLIGYTVPTTSTGMDATLSFSASNGTAPYLYSLDNSNFQASNSFTNLAGGEYYIVTKDANGCSSFRGFSQDDVYIPNDMFLIQYNGGGGSVSCNPFKATLLVSGNNTSGGTPPYTYSIDGINYQTAPFNDLPAGVYNIRVKDAAGYILIHAYTFPDYCTATFSVSTATQSAICGINGSITATAFLGEPPYTYSIDGVNFTNNNVFTGLAAGGYTITVKDAYGFINSKYVLVANNCVQVIPTTSSSTCGNNNGSITATATNGTAPYQYALGTGAYSSNNVFTGLAAASYTVKVKDATARVATANTIVSNIAGAQIAAADTTPTSCSNNTGTINVLAQAGTTPYLYSIDGSNFVSSNIFTGLAQNNYTVTVKDGRGCLTTKPALITLANTLQVDAGDTLKICEGKNGTTNATGNATTYAWLPTGGLTTPAQLNTAAKPTVTTTYYLTGTTGVCTKKDSMQVLVKPAPIANAGQGSTICYGQSTTLLAAAGQQSYTWSPTTYLANINGATAEVVKPQSNITYSLSVVGTNGCASLQAAQVTIQVTPPPKVFVGNDTSIAIGEPFTIAAQDVNNSGFNQYTWQPSFLLVDAAAQNAIIKNATTNTLFSVIASTAAGCVGKDSIYIKVFTKPDIYVPNAFTPNGDGTNDLLKAIPVGIKTFNSFTVFDRYGHTIFTSKNAYQGWDGTINGAAQNTGSFVWLATGVDFNGRVVERKGAVLLVR
jgi:gliding motility-associated-like protein